MSILDYIKYPPEILLLLDRKIKILHVLPDKIYLKLRFRIKMHRKLNLKNPKSFSEKLQWLKLYDRNPEYVKMVDKYEAKKYVADIIGEEYIIPTLGIYDKFDDIDFDKLPKQFVIKCTHDSGGIVVCHDKEKLDMMEAKKKIEKLLKINYFYQGREWPYKKLRPRIIIEPYMEDTVAKELIDYKMMCFNGKVQMLFTCTERFSSDGLKVTFFDLNWNKLPFERKYRSSKEKIAKPINFTKMVKFSEKLSKSIPFVRIDWYEINGKLYFGEITFYPGSGLEKFYPDKWDYILGDYITLNDKKRKSGE